MKNHWLDKKVDREIDDAFANINLSLDAVDLSDVVNTNDMEENDRATVTEILLKYKDKPHWIDEVLTDIKYMPAPDPFLGNLTISTANWVMPGGDGITLNDNITISGGFPQDDANSLQQWSAGDANLDIFYPDNVFIQNEQLQVLEDKGHIVTFQTMYTPVMPGTMTGTIYPTPGNRAYGYVFYVSSAGEFNFTRFVQNDDGKVEYANGSSDPWKKKCDDALSLQQMVNGDDRFLGWYDEVYVSGTNINLATGVLKLHYNMGHCPEIIVSYEYGREC